MSESTTTTAPAPTANQASTAAITPTTEAHAQASLGQRAGAYLIDVAVVMAISLVFSLTVGQIASILGSIGTLASLAYIICRDCIPFLDGQSVGKKLVGLRAVTTDGQSLSGNWQPGLIRNAVLAIPVMALVEFIILCTKQNAPEGLIRLGDQWAGTKVITVK